MLVTIFILTMQYHSRGARVYYRFLYILIPLTKNGSKAV